MAKGPKYLNPADRARKEARKRELKKNKKQREQVRSAAIKGRDPEQIIAELKSIDKLEYEPSNCDQEQPATANIELVCRDKRKRLKELLQRILAHYQKEEPERYEELKKLEAEYEVGHKKAEREYAAIKAAKEVQIDEVFLPPDAAPVDPLNVEDEIADDDPLLSETIYITPLTEAVEPPGCPQGPPPDLRSLVECLKDHLSLAAIMAGTHAPPPTLPNRFQKRGGAIRQRSNHLIKKGPSTAHSSEMSQSSSRQSTLQPQQTSRSSDTTNRPTEIKKAAVIESKPIRFMPKATKFVPASVRSKLAPKADDKSM